MKRSLMREKKKKKKENFKWLLKAKYAGKQLY